MAVTAAARPIRIGWVVPVAVTVFFLLFGLVVAVETATSFADARDRRTRVLGEVITADESPAAPAPATGRP